MRIQIIHYQQQDFYLFILTTLSLGIIAGFVGGNLKDDPWF
jgi:hypothetical protein